MLLLLTIGALLTVVAATPPSCAIFFANDTCAEKFNKVWVSAAQEEAVRVYHTINGGYLPDACTTGPKQGAKRIEAIGANLNTLLCIDPTCLPDKCAFAKCNYTLHPELFGDDKTHRDDDDDCDDDHSDKDKDKASCRKISSWLRIAIEKLARALDLQEAGDFELSSSYACVAELLFGRIAKYFDTAYDSSDLWFINAQARATHSYEHLVSPTTELTFVGEQNSTSVPLRFVQSIRTCTTRGDAVNAVGSVLIYAHYNDSAAPTSQVAWAVAGSIPSFDITLHAVAPDNLCVIEKTPTNLEEFDETRRFPQLSALDWAVVLGDSSPRSYLNLQSASTCPAVVLLQQLGAGAVTSVTQLNSRRPINPQSEATFGDEQLTASVFLRQATIDGCTDALGEVIPPESLQFAIANTRSLSLIDKPDVVVPLTLAPGESRCVGGDKAGVQCSMASECGAGWACRRKPFSPANVAYCYDGISWDTTRACAFADADDECPFGECVGDVNGLDGGAYPFLYFYKENDCDNNAASPVCSDPHVIDWQAYPNEFASF